MSPERLAEIKELCEGASGSGLRPNPHGGYYKALGLKIKLSCAVSELVAEVERLQDALEVEEQMRIQDYKNATKKSSYATGWEIP